MKSKIFLEKQMQVARRFYEKNNVQKTCQVLLEIMKYCEENEIQLPADFEELARLCMLQDALELWNAKQK